MSDTPRFVSSGPTTVRFVPYAGGEARTLPVQSVDLTGLVTVDGLSVAADGLGRAAGVMRDLTVTADLTGKALTALLDLINEAIDDSDDDVRRIADLHGIPESDIRDWTWCADDDWRWIDVRLWNGRTVRLDTEGPRRRVWGRG